MRSSGDCVPVGDGVQRATSAQSASRHSRLAGRVSWDGSIPGGVAGARAGRRAGLAAGRRVGRGSRSAGRGGGETVMRSMIGTAAALASMAVLTVAMIPLRSHLSIATTALVLIVPVVIGVVLGGVVAGALSVIGGFPGYHWDFLPPLHHPLVGGPPNRGAARGYRPAVPPRAPLLAQT